MQRFKTQLARYTDISEDANAKIDALLPEDRMHAFRSAYLETAQQLKKKQEKQGGEASPKIIQLDFEFVLFASAVIDYGW